jgi:hypothetical protein
MIDNVLGKLVMVAFIVAMTIYNRIAGIVALILVIALLNQNPTKEGLTFGNPMTTSISTPAPISFKSPDEFRQKYCLKGVADDPTQSGKLPFTYMLSPDFFTLDASGNPTITKEEIGAFESMDSGSFNKCTPLTVKNGGQMYETIHNMCDPACNWITKPASITAPSTAPSTAPTAMPTAIPSLPPNDDTNTTEGFNPMSALRPHIRAGRHLVTDGAANVKSVANRLKRQLF